MAVRTSFLHYNTHPLNPSTQHMVSPPLLPHPSLAGGPPLSSGGVFLFTLLRLPLTSFTSWLLVSLFTLPVAMSLAEICSVYPTSAGAYYWCYRLAPPRSRLLLSWINGWLNLVGVWTISLSVTFVRFFSSIFPPIAYFGMKKGNSTATRGGCGHLSP